MHIVRTRKNVLHFTYCTHSPTRATAQSSNIWRGACVYFFAYTHGWMGRRAKMRRTFQTKYKRVRARARCGMAHQRTNTVFILFPRRNDWAGLLATSGCPQDIMQYILTFGTFCKHHQLAGQSSQRRMRTSSSSSSTAKRQ